RAAEGPTAPALPGTRRVGVARDAPRRIGVPVWRPGEVRRPGTAAAPVDAAGADPAGVPAGGQEVPGRLAGRLRDEPLRLFPDGHQPAAGDDAPGFFGPAASARTDLGEIRNPKHEIRNKLK